MRQGIDTINSVLKTLDLTILSTRNDSRFFIFKTWVIDSPNQSQINNMNPNTILELRDSFNLSLIPHSLPADAGLLFPNGIAITRNGISYYPSSVPFYGSSLQCNDLTLQEWQTLMASNHPFVPEMRYKSVYYSNYDAITFASNWTYIGFPQEVIFFATLPVANIINLLADTDVAETAYIKMYDANGKTLFSRNNKNDKHFHIINHQSSIYSIKYEIGIPDSYIAKKIQHVKNQILFFTGITAVFVLILSFLFAWRSSLPERSFLERIHMAGNTPTGFNVFTSLKKIYHDLAENISTEKNQLEMSLRIIETQTTLIRTQTIDKIKEALISGNEIMAKTILKDCTTVLPQPEDPLITAFLAKMLSAMIQDITTELKGIIKPLELPEYKPGNQREIFEQKYPEYFNRICESVRVNKNKNISTQGREVLAYINEHLYDPNLYITMVAAHFDISAPTLQKLVRQCTEKTFLDYVEKHRLDKASELLASTGDSVAQIAHICGFSSAATFSRSFKRIYGFPPSRLQEMHRS